MRKLLFLLTFVLAACSGNGDGPKDAPEPAQHLPEILNLTLSPSSAQQWEGDGSVVVTTEITFSDAGRDVATLWVRLPDGSTFEFDEAIGVETGTFSEALDIPTIQVGTILVEIWLEDSAGDSSAHRVAEFSVVGDGQQAGDWISRLGGLPHSLSDVIWNGRVFIAVGGEGTILTSADGIYWMVRESGTDVFLDAISAHGNEIFAVGSETLLLSTDNGETWITKSVPETIIPRAIAASSTQVVVGGMTQSFDPIMVVSEDRGDTWQLLDTWPEEPMYFADLNFRDGLFVAAAVTMSFHPAGGWVFASPDGTVWSDIFYDPQTGFNTVVNDGSRITIAGSYGRAITSLDGFNWTDMQTPLETIDYWSGASNGKKLILAGGYYCEFICFEPVSLPMGVATTNGGMSWEVFNIGGEFLSFGMAFGNGRFVSVGQAAWLSGEGAIYTSN